MTPYIPTIEQKCKGAFIAAAIGDALGWPNECPKKTIGVREKVSTHFTEWVRKGSRPDYYSEKIMAGEYSDDTQLTLAVARSIITGNWEFFFMKRELPFWLYYERGGGRAVLRAARFYAETDNYKLWESKYKKDYFNAGGNGAAMRIAPHVIENSLCQNLSKLMLDVFKNTMITHGHPRAFLGAMCYAYALDYLLRKTSSLKMGELIQAVVDGKNDWSSLSAFNVFDQWMETASKDGGYNFQHEWEITCNRMIIHLTVLQKELKKAPLLDDNEILRKLDCFGKAKGAGDVSILAALYLASKYASNSILGIKVPAFSYGADTDTIASMTGGLLGMLNGIDWLPPEWLQLQDYTCLSHIVDLLLAENRKELVKEETLTLEQNEDGWQTTLIGKMKRINLQGFLEQNQNTTTISKWKTTLGQTLYRRDSGYHSSASQPAVVLQQVSTSSAMNIQETPAPPPSYANEPLFSLSKEDIVALLTDPVFNKKTTCGKLLEAVYLILENKLSSSDIAKKLRWNESMIDRLKHHIK